MKRLFHRILLSMLLILAAVCQTQAAKGYLDTLDISLCQGDTMTMLKHPVKVYQDTVLFDTINVINPRQDSIHVYVVNVYPIVSLVEHHEIYSDETYPWQGENLSSAGTYTKVLQSVHGCDSILNLVLTVHKVDTIDTVAVICPGERFEWHSISTSQSGHHEAVETNAQGDRTRYRLDLTVMELQTVEKFFYLCGDDGFQFNGKYYDQPGYYYDKGACDTLYKITLIQAPKQVYITNASLTGNNPYAWTFWRDGVKIDSLFAIPGTYEFTSTDPVTGCDNVWRLILRQDEIIYHFVDKIMVCEGEPFVWRGRENLSNVPGTNTYKEHLYTLAGQDSIYELQLTVRPIQHGYRTINFCGSIEWQGTIYNQSAMVYDTLTSLNGCDSIVEVSLRKVHGFLRIDTATIVQGEKLLWHGLTILTSGVYYDKNTTVNGCDSIYELHVGISPAAPQTHMLTTFAEICEGDYFTWRGNNYHNQGIYPDTVKGAGPDGKDSIYVLNLHVAEVERRRELYTFCEGGRMQSVYGVDYTNRVKTGVVFRDTVTVPNSAHPGCPDTVYLEIYKYPKTHYTETRVLHPGDTIHWYGHTFVSAGIYSFSDPDAGPGGCGVDSTLRVIADMRDYIFACSADLPIRWRDRMYNTSGVWYDTVFNTIGEIEQFYSLDLSIRQTPDTTVYLHGCRANGVVWRDQLFKQDTTFIDHVPQIPYNPEIPCDMIYHVHIKIDTTYTARIDTTLCEFQLPLIIGRINPDTIWWEGNFQHKGDTTACGCDSLIEGHLTIIPSLDHNDSTFICSDVIQTNPVVLGNIVHPAFIENDNSRWAGTWEGKWTGVKYYTDTIVWDCDHRYFHHIFVRPSQTVVPEKNFYLCPDDSLQLFWPYDTSWFYKDTVYYERRPMTSAWSDEVHGNTFHDDRLICDSLTRWNIKVLPRRDRTITRHILIGDSLQWAGIWRHHTGYYDTILVTTDTSSLGDTCHYVQTLHLIVDTAYLLHDTAEVCDHAAMTITHHWDDGHITTFNTPDKDSSFHVIQTYRSHSTLGLDSIYDLFVHFRKTSMTVLYDTICPGDSVQFDRHWFSDNNNLTVEQYIKQAGDYCDTITALNGCDSIVTLHLYVRERIPTTHQTVHIADTDAPYIWTHRWTGEDGQPIDSVRTLWASGHYSCHMKSILGCDSIDSLSLYIHPTYYITDDTINLCQKETPYTWRGKDNITVTGNYVYSALTMDGFDSTHVVHINVWPQQYTELYYTTCQGDSLVLNGKTYTRPGVYTDTLYTWHGCDSVLTIHYNWNDAYLITKTAQTDDQTPYVWTEGDITRVLSHSGTYFDTLKTIHGCDSIIALTLTVYTTYLFEENRVICASEAPYMWHGKQYWTSGTYTDSLHTVQFYDSVYVLHLTVSDTFYVDEYFSICQGESFVYYGKTYSQGGVYLDTLTTRDGCDSVVIIHIQERPHYFFSDTATVSNVQPYIWRGQELTHTGTFRDTLTATTGCDSVYQLVLTIYDKEVRRDTIIRVCQNELPVQWRNKWFNESGIYLDTVTAHDVDTIWNIDLLVIPMEYETIEKTLCEGDSYTFNNRVFTHDTLVHDTAFTGYGCGREYTLFLHFRKTHVIEVYESTPSDRPFIWNIEDTTYSYRFDGTYEHVVRYTDDQCDSIRYVLHLSVGPVYQYRDSMKLCQSELPYLWHNQMIYEAGTYYDSLQTVMGFDSVYTLKVLEIMPAYYGEYNIDLCDGSTAFYYRGKPYSTAGVFYDTIPSVNGCDSVFRITVRVLPTYELFDTVHISDKEKYEFNGRILDVPGPYVAYKKTASGCDSILHLQLFVHPSYFFPEDEEICQKDSFTWHGRLLYKAGVYYDSLLTTQGYDSVYQLTLTVHDTYFMEENIELCPNRTTYLHGIEISTPGIYMDTLYSVHGCDSVYRITVNETRTFKQEFSDTICQGESYNFFGVNYTTTRTVKYEIGCDSVIILHLYVRTRDILEEKVVIADEDLPYRYYGEEYWNTGLYVDTFTNRFGCDSIRKLNLTVSEHVSPWYQMPLCPGSEIKIGGDIITESGLYTYLLRSKVSGLMDSIYRVEVYDAPAFDLPVETRQICQGDTIEFAGRKLWRSGHYDFPLKTIDGCDSLLHLDLTVNPTYQFYIDATIRDFETYYWRGSNYSLPGNYDITFPTHEGCDSTYTLRLSVLETKRYDTFDTICDGNTYNWRGRDYGTEGSYADTVYNPQTNLSAIYTLQLVVLHPTIITKATAADICADAQTIDIAFTYTGAQPTKYSIYFDQLAKDEGFVDVINRPLYGEDKIAQAELPVHDKIVYAEHTEYVKPNTYLLRLVLDNGICGKNSYDSIQLLIKYPNWIIEQNWNDVVTPLGTAYNGGYQFSEIEWYVNDVKQADNGLGYLQTEFKENDQVVMLATRKGESYSVPTCPLTIHINSKLAYDEPILVYPTHVSRMSPRITIEAPHEGQSAVYNATGTLLFQNELHEGANTLTLPAVSGIYFIRTTQGNETESHKIMIY